MQKISNILLLETKLCSIFMQKLYVCLKPVYVVGQTLFNISVNDIVLCANKCAIQLFVDDTVIYVAGLDICIIITLSK